MNVEQLIDMLSEYQEGELDDGGKMFLKDDLIDLSEQLHEEDIAEGRFYESMILLIKQGDDLPQLYEEMIFKSPLTGDQIRIKIKEITGLRHNSNGDLVVDVLAMKKG